MRTALLAFGLLMFAACGPRVVYEQQVSLPGYWSYADSAVFEYTIADTSLAYNLKLSLQHTDAFATQNLYARFVTHYPNGTVQSEPVSLELADRFGQWLGECSGADCTLDLTLQEAARYPEPGTYGLTLHQYGRSDSLSGVTGIALSVHEY